jgi:hypothetical protein
VVGRGIQIETVTETVNGTGIEREIAAQIKTGTETGTGIGIEISAAKRERIVPKSRRRSSLKRRTTSLRKRRLRICYGRARESRRNNRNWKSTRL